MRYLVLTALALAGCASRPLTPQEQAFIQQYTLQQQRIQAQQADAVTRAYGSVQPVQLPPQSAPVIQQPITCTSSTTFGTTTTTCR